MVTTLRVLNDRYRIESKIATGGMGTVYSATDERLDRSVAVKILDDRLAEDPAFVERFRREARSVAALAHPNIARVFDYVEADDEHFIVMELVEGEDLARLLQREDALSPDRAGRIAIQMCAALDHAHSAGIVHRDMKPANVIVTDGDTVKVTDFGIARAVGESKLTVTGAVMGSAHYISPEQANGKEIGPASDIYSTGVVLYEMLTGRVPFTGESLMAVAAKHLTDSVPRPSATNRSIPAVYDDIVERATAKDPRHRYSDAASLQQALQDAARGAGGGTAPATTARLDAADSTDVLVATDETRTVWPIPGNRWDPHRVGRIVLAAFGVLAIVAAALLVARLGDVDRRARSDEPVTNESPAAPAFTMPSEDLLIGASQEAVTNVLDDWGVEYSIQTVSAEDYGLDLAEGRIVATRPAPGEQVGAGEVVTLFVSDGGEDGEGDQPDERGEPPGKAKGKEKD